MVGEDNSGDLVFNGELGVLDTHGDFNYNRSVGHGLKLLQ